MRAREAAATLLLGILLPAVSPALPAAEPPPPEVVFYSPVEGRPAHGDTRIEVDVYADGVREVVFLVDGTEVGRVSRPPYRLTVPLGESFVAHRFEAVALGADGELVRGALETPPLRIDEQLDLGLQQLYVTVDGAGSGGSSPLDREDFQVLDNEVPQEIVTFERGDAALTVGLLVDASASMRGGRLEAALEGVRAFLEGMRELDEAALYLFSDSIRFRSPFLERAESLRGALASVDAGGGTAIHDALYVAIRQLEARQGRRVVVLLSDGTDIHSALPAEDVLWAMRRSRSLVYWIELDAGRGGGRTSPWRTLERHRREREDLGRLVVESGGRIVPIATPAEAAAAFQDILAELRRQYVLGYYPSEMAKDGRWHAVDVRIARRGIRARTRGGYVAH